MRATNIRQNYGQVIVFFFFLKKSFYIYGREHVRPSDSSCVIIPKSKEWARNENKFINLRMQSLVEI